MFNSSTIRQMVDEVIREHDLPYEPRRFFEPPESSWTWCCEFADPTVSEPHRTFDMLAGRLWILVLAATLTAPPLVNLLRVIPRTI